MDGRVVLDEGAIHNRTTYVVEDTPENDPLNFETQKEPVEEQVPVPEAEPEKPEQEKPETEAQIEEETAPVEYKEEVYQDLNKVFQAKAGVDFDAAIAILAELAQWKLDIDAMAGGVNQPAAQPQAAQQIPVPPAFQRSQSRQTSPAVAAYDYKKSDIQRMSRQEYEEKAQDITRAYIQGRVFNDVR